MKGLDLSGLPVWAQIAIPVVVMVFLWFYFKREHQKQHETWVREAK
jgi:hypothetical protein